MDSKTSFFSNDLIKSNARVSGTENIHQLQLHRNESPNDIDDNLKQIVIESLFKTSWNRYPAPDNKEIEYLIGDYIGVNAENIVVSAGAANLITCLFNYFSHQNFSIVIAQPSFSLYEYHCKTFGIQYVTWKLNDQLEYDLSLFPTTKDKSLVVFASPNNPVGNCLSIDDMEKLLIEYPQSLFLVDEVYYEFSGATFQPLLGKYSNLILVRSFSKTFSAAGVRLGYGICSADHAAQIRKLILPFSLNHFASIFAKSLLNNTNLRDVNESFIKSIINERDKLYYELKKLSNYSHFDLGFSFGNFLLIRFSSPDIFDRYLNALSESGIQVLNVSGTPMLENCLRVTIGSQNENDAFLSVINKLCSYL